MKKVGQHQNKFSLVYSNTTNLNQANNPIKYADDTTLMAESKEELKSFLMKVKEDSKKVGLKAQLSET